MEVDSLCQRIGFELPSLMVETVVGHYQDVTQARLAERYASLGHAVMNCVHSVLLYVEREVVSQDDISKYLPRFSSFSTKRLYEEYKLADYSGSVPKARGKQRDAVTPEPDVVARLVGAIYLEHGLAAAFALLQDRCLDVPLMSSKEYKDLVQRYARDRGRIPRYSIVGQPITSGGRGCVCELVVGGLSVKGIGANRRSSEAEAARVFFDKYIGYSHGDLPNSPHDAEATISEEREELLNCVMAKLGAIEGLDEEAFRPYLDDIFPRSPNVGGSAQFEPDQALGLLGQTTLIMLANEYALRHARRELNEEADETTHLIIDEAVSSVAFDEVANVFRHELPAEAFDGRPPDSLVANALKCILAVLAIFVYFDHDEGVVQALRRISTDMFMMAEAMDGTHPMSAVQAIVEKFGLETAWDLVDTDDGDVSGELIVSGADWILSSVGSGTDERSAHVQACGRMLVPLRTHCGIEVPNDEFEPEDGIEDDPAALQLADSPASDADPSQETRDPAEDEGGQIRDNGPRVPSETDGHTEDEEHQTPLPRLSSDEDETANKPETDDAIREPSSGEVARDGTANGSATTPSAGGGGDNAPSDEAKGNYADTSETEDPDGPVTCVDAEDGVLAPLKIDEDCRLYVCRHLPNETRVGHMVEAVSKALRTLEGDVVEIEGKFCPSLNACFATYESFRMLRHASGPLLGPFTIIAGWDARGARMLSEDEPALLMLGYSASEIMGLTDAQRREILSNAFVQQTISPDTVCRQLEFFVELGSRRASMAGLSKRWRSDLDWLRKSQ